VFVSVSLSTHIPLTVNGIIATTSSLIRSWRAFSA
jgi:hypothetical protein